MIAYELYQKGIDRELIDRALELVDEDEEEESGFCIG